MADTLIETPANPELAVSTSTSAGTLQRLSAMVLIVLPLVGLVWATAWAWDDGVSRVALVIAVGMYLVTGHGLSVGFHRMLTHRSFRPRRALKIALAIAGSMAAEGSVFTWVAQHRRHHAYADTRGDPHSPWTYGSGFGPQLRGLWHAHVGWFFESNPSDPERWIPDLRSDRDLQVISRTATLWALLSLAIPTLLGWLLTGTLTGALAALVWAGGVRIFLLHHVTWSVNSVGHMFGNRPFHTRDSSTNFAPLALLSFGDSWHNAHHAYPRLARHGIDRGQIDSSARLIRVFERLHCASDVNWPSHTSTERRRHLQPRTAADETRGNRGEPSTPVSPGQAPDRQIISPDAAHHTGTEAIRDAGLRNRHGEVMASATDRYRETTRRSPAASTEPRA